MLCSSIDAPESNREPERRAHLHKLKRHKYYSDNERGYHVPIANQKTVEGKYSAGVDMSNDGAVIQGDIAAQLDEIGFSHKHCTSTST